MGLLVFSVFLMVSAFSRAESFFPSPDSLFGQAMPSLTSVTGRLPDEERETDGGALKVYHNLTGEEYTAFSQYLMGTGCELKSSAVDGDVLTAVITRAGAQITFTFDNATGEASVLYPSDTRMEDRKQDAEGKGDLLLDFLQTFGKKLPSMGPVVNKSPKKEALEDGGTRYSYSGVTEAQYDAFSRYLAAYGCALDAFEARGGVAKASLSRGNAVFSFTYDSHALTAVIDYPTFSFVEDMEALTENTEVLLPLAGEAFGVMMPRIALGKL